MARDDQPPSPAAWPGFAAVSVATILTVVAFLRPARDLIQSWSAEEYSYAYIVPAIAALMLWHILAEHRPRPTPAWTGSAVVFFGIGLLVVGELSTLRQIAHYGFLATLTGIGLTFLGHRAMRLALPAFVYLLFAIPLPPQLHNSMSLDMQLWSSTLGVWLLDGLGRSVFQDGNVIDLGGFKLQVVDACSGLRYLFPLLSFSYLVAYTLSDRMWKKAVILLSALPITIGMNALRIAIIGLTVDLWGIEMAQGVLHDFEGWTIFAGCTAILLAEAWVLSRIAGRGTFRLDLFTRPEGKLLDGPVRLNGPGYVALCLLSAATALSVSGLLVDRKSPELPVVWLGQLPVNIGEWRGRTDSLDPATLKSLALDDYWLADYSTSDSEPPISLYVAYYRQQTMGSAIHSPSTCIPGGGWRVESTEHRAVHVGAQTIPIARLVIRRGEARQLVYYWFDERGKIVTSQLGAKWSLLVDSILLNRTDGSLIRILTAIGPQETMDQAEARLAAFLSAAYPPIDMALHP